MTTRPPGVGMMVSSSVPPWPAQVTQPWSASSRIATCRKPGWAPRPTRSLPNSVRSAAARARSAPCDASAAMVEPIAMPSICRHTMPQTRVARARRTPGVSHRAAQEVRDGRGQARDVEQEGAVAEVAVQHHVPRIAAGRQQGLVHAVGFGRRVAPVLPVAQEQHPGGNRRQRLLQGAVLALQVEVLHRAGEVHEAVRVQLMAGLRGEPGDERLHLELGVQRVPAASRAGGPGWPGCQERLGRPGGGQPGGGRSARPSPRRSSTAAPPRRSRRPARRTGTTPRSSRLRSRLGRRGSAGASP